MLTLATNSATALAYFLLREQGVFTNEETKTFNQVSGKSQTATQVYLSQLRAFNL